MNNSMFTKKKFFWTAIVLCLFVLLFILPLFVDVEAASRSNKISAFAQLNMKNIGTAILKHANKEESGIFPENLDKLVQEGYLTKEQKFSPLDNEEYFYVSGFDLTLPHSVPLLIEKNASHIAPRGIRYGLILYGDFYLGSYREENIDYYKTLMDRLQEIANIEDPEVLLYKLDKELEFSRNSIIINVLLWRLGKAQYSPAQKTMEKCLRYYNPAEVDEVLFARSIAVEASYSLNILKKPYNKDIIKQLLQSENYHYRKKAWLTLTGDSNMLTPMSPFHINAWLQENK